MQAYAEDKYMHRYHLSLIIAWLSFVLVCRLY